MSWMDLARIGLLGGSFGGGLYATPSSTSPTTDPAYGPLQAMLLQQIQQRLANPTGLPANYETGGIKTINSAYDLTGQNTANSLTARGLSTSPIAGAAIAQANRARAGSIGDFRANVPIVAQQLQNQDMNLAQQILSYGRGTQSSQGGGVGGGLESLMQMMGYMHAKGMFGPAAGAVGSGVGAVGAGSGALTGGIGVGGAAGTGDWGGIAALSGGGSTAANLSGLAIPLGVAGLGYKLGWYGPNAYDANVVHPVAGGYAANGLTPIQLQKGVADTGMNSLQAYLRSMGY